MLLKQETSPNIMAQYWRVTKSASPGEGQVFGLLGPNGAEKAPWLK
jgi:ABC-type Na+ transport system ATPase subunit NatA